LRSQELATSLSSYDIIVVHCGTHADLWLTATFPLLWDLAASFNEAVRDQNLSLFLRHNRRLVASSSPTCIRAHRRLRHHCRLTTSLPFTAALVPSFLCASPLTCLSPNNVGQTLSLHYYYLAFVVLTHY
jgi:hypothetical protein